MQTNQITNEIGVINKYIVDKNSRNEVIIGQFQVELATEFRLQFFLSSHSKWLVDSACFFRTQYHAYLEIDILITCVVCD